MPTKVEKDEVTGTDTTGHEWDGIKELNTPLPKWWVYVFWATIIWSVGYYVLYPAIPGLTGYTKGVLGYSSRIDLEQNLEAAAAQKAPMTNRIAGASFADIRQDAELFNFAVAGGRTAFADNCAPCHGSGGGGARGYPNLADDDWLWGGGIDRIQQTILYGIRAENDDTRTSEMPKFGGDELLEPAQIKDVAEFVLTLSGQNGDSAAAARGRPIFQEQCASCHGPNGDGKQDEVGAPRLNDQIWLYGGTREDITAQVISPKHGVMPSWANRLDDITIKMLAIYVQSLGGAR